MGFVAVLFFAFGLYFVPMAIAGSSTAGLSGSKSNTQNGGNYQQRNNGRQDRGNYQQRNKGRQDRGGYQQGDNRRLDSSGSQQGDNGRQGGSDQ